MTNHLLHISVIKQSLEYLRNDRLFKTYAISTALKGVGEQHGSEQTPRGWHVIRAKIGENQPVNTVFVGRRPTGEIYSTELGQLNPNRDWILTRILWLSGLERGKNRFGNCDTMKRYIYIHGVPDHKIMGQPGSKGCINMRNADIIELFSEVPVGTKVYIEG